VAQALGQRIPIPQETTKATVTIDPNRTFAVRIAPPHSGHWVSACCCAAGHRPRSPIGARILLQAVQRTRCVANVLMDLGGNHRGLQGTVPEQELDRTDIRSLRQ